MSIDFDRRRAFSLIEVLVYMAVSSIALLLVFDFYARTSRDIKKLSVDCENNIRAELALDLMRRDLISASIKPSDWDMEIPVFRKFFLKKEEARFLDICWQVRNKKLERIEGVYDYFLKKWIEKKRGFASYNAKKLNVDVKVDSFLNLVRGVSFEYFDLDDNVFDGFVELKNRGL